MAFRRTGLRRTCLVRFIPWRLMNLRNLWIRSTSSWEISSKKQRASLIELKIQIHGLCMAMKNQASGETRECKMGVLSLSYQLRDLRYTLIGCSIYDYLIPQTLRDLGSAKIESSSPLSNIDMATACRLCKSVRILDRNIQQDFMVLEMESMDDRSSLNLGRPCKTHNTRRSKSVFYEAKT